MPARLVPVERREGEASRRESCATPTCWPTACGPRGRPTCTTPRTACRRDRCWLRAEGACPPWCAPSTTSTPSATRAHRVPARLDPGRRPPRVRHRRSGPSAMDARLRRRPRVVPNGVDVTRFARRCDRSPPAAALRLGRPARGAGGGGHRAAQGQPAPARGVRPGARRLGDGALLAIAGGETLFDYPSTAQAWRGTPRAWACRSTTARGRPDGADVACSGPIADDADAALYRAADALALPSTREGFGLVVMEALAAGLPGRGDRPAGASASTSRTAATA